MRMCRSPKVRRVWGTPRSKRGRCRSSPTQVFDPLAVQQGDSTAEKADNRRRLLVKWHLDRGQPRSVIDRDMVVVVSHVEGTTPLPDSGGAAAHIPESGQGPDDDVDQVARPVPKAYRCTGGLGSRLDKRPSPRRLTALASVEKGACIPRDVAQMQPLVSEIHGVLHSLRTEHPPLSAPNTPSILQRGCTT